MLASTTSLVNHELKDISEAQQLSGWHHVTLIDQLMEHCSQAKVCVVTTYRLFCAELMSVTFARIVNNKVPTANNWQSIFWRMA